MGVGVCWGMEAMDGTSWKGRLVWRRPSKVLCACCVAHGSPPTPSRLPAQPLEDADGDGVFSGLGSRLKQLGGGGGGAANGGGGV